MNNISIDEVAKWFVIGFTRCWTLGQVDAACGLGFFNGKSEFCIVHERYPFWPKFWNAKTQVRAVVASEWPRLFMYLDKNTKNPEKLLKAIPELIKLTAKKSRTVIESKDDRREIDKSRKAMRNSTSSYRISRDAFKSHRRSAWNVCKG